jgi:D-aminopeptidase
MRTESPIKRPRLRELGIYRSGFEAGQLNAITDVSGVRLGQVTLIEGEGRLRAGKGPVRTGVTVILPHEGNLYQEKVRAAVHTINGFGKVIGFEQVREVGLIESPIALTNTLNVGLVIDALVQYAIRQNPDLISFNAMVGETNDGYLNDIQGRHVKVEHVWRAIDEASTGAVAEGAVGAGTGTVCFGWKGGIGTASRVIPEALGGFKLGAMVQSNFGRAADLTIYGRPVGSMLIPDPHVEQIKVGSVMVVMATDAPLDANQLRRLCVRAGAGLARTGATFSYKSGDFVIAFSTANRLAHKAQALVEKIDALADDAGVMEALFRAVIDSVEEAVLNSLTCAETVVGRDGHTAQALPLEPLLEILNREHGEI